MVRTGMVAVCAAGLFLALCDNARAQGRLNDSDVKELIKNLKEDAKKFADEFEDDLEKSTIRDTSEEKSAKRTSERFVEQVDEMLDRFRDKKELDRWLPSVYQTYTRLSGYVARVPLRNKTTEYWEKVRSEMERIREAANYVPPA